MKLFIKNLLFLFAIYFVGSCNFAFAETAVYGGVISENTTWTKDDSPYVIYGPEESSEPFSVASGTTLTIEAGVVMKFDYSQSITVLGKLIVSGTADEKVYFTSIDDDSVGGDVDGDEGLVEPYENDWSGIQILPGGYLELTNSIISYSEAGVVLENSSGVISNSLIKNCQNGPIIFFGSLLNINNSEIFNILDDLFIIYEGSKLNIKNSNIIDIGGDAVGVYYNSSLSILNSNFENIGGNFLYMYQNSESVIENSSIKNIQDKILFYDKSILDVLNTSLDSILGSGSITFYNDSNLKLKDSIIKNVSGKAVEGYGTSWGNISTTTLYIENTLISGGDDIGLQIFGEKTEAYISKTKIENFLGDGVQVFSYPYIFIDESEIVNNNNGLVSWGANVEIKNSIISDNITYAISNNPVQSGAPEIKAVNNWWGDKSGPFNEEINSSGTANQVSSNVAIQPWLNWDPRIPRKTPVIIVPGLLGTELSDGDGLLWVNVIKMLADIGDQFMDVLSFDNNLSSVNSNIIIGDILKKVVTLDYSDNLVKILLSQNYVEGTSSDANLFTFPYDWRYGVTGVMSNGSTTADLLKNKIEDIRKLTGSDKVDVIAHSTGGLIVKKYVIDNQIDNHINKAIFVGVPNTGAPKAVKSLLQGDNAGIPWLSSQEMKKLFTNFPVTYDLLPSRQYYDVKGSYVKIVNENFLKDTINKDLDYDDINNFLVNDHLLNATAAIHAENLHTQDFDNFDMRTVGIDLYSINGCKAGTLGKITEVRHVGYGGIESVWYQKPIEVPGDNTVPLESSTNLPIDQDHKFYALKANHSQMMSQSGIKEKITNILSGSQLHVDDKLITQDISKCKLNGKAISVFSPLDIDVIDQYGNHTGIDIDANITNDIPNADIQVWDDHKFIYLPTDDGQVYTVNIRGTGVGSYTIKNDTILDDKYIKTDKFSNLPVTPELIGSIDISLDVTMLRVQATPSSPVEIIKPDAENLPVQQQLVNLSSGSAILITDTATRDFKILSTSTSDNISTTTIKTSKNISKEVLDVKTYKVDKKVIKPIENQVATVINSNSNTGIFEYIKGLIKKVFFFWKK